MSEDSFVVDGVGEFLKSLLGLQPCEPTAQAEARVFAASFEAEYGSTRPAFFEGDFKAAWRAVSRPWLDPIFEFDIIEVISPTEGPNLHVGILEQSTSSQATTTHHAFDTHAPECVLAW
jgi:hypothetical protein